MTRVRKHRSCDSSVFIWQSGGASWDKLPGRERPRSLPRNPVCFLLSLSIREADGWVQGALLRRLAVRFTAWEVQKGGGLAIVTFFL